MNTFPLIFSSFFNYFLYRKDNANKHGENLIFSKGEKSKLTFTRVIICWHKTQISHKLHKSSTVITILLVLINEKIETQNK